MAAVPLYMGKKREKARARCSSFQIRKGTENEHAEAANEFRRIARRRSRQEKDQGTAVGSQGANRETRKAASDAGDGGEDSSPERRP